MTRGRFRIWLDVIPVHTRIVPQRRVRMPEAEGSVRSSHPHPSSYAWHSACSCGLNWSADFAIFSRRNCSAVSDSNRCTSASNSAQSQDWHMNVMAVGSPPRSATIS